MLLRDTTQLTFMVTITVLFSYAQTLICWRQKWNGNLHPHGLVHEARCWWNGILLSRNCTHVQNTMLDDTAFRMKTLLLKTTGQKTRPKILLFPWQQDGLLVFSNCWMTWKNQKPSKINPNCLLSATVTNVWVMKIQPDSLLQMSVNDAFYFRVMSMLYIEEGKKKPNTKEQQLEKNQYYEKHDFPNPDLLQTAEHPKTLTYLPWCQIIYTHPIPYMENAS